MANNEGSGETARIAEIERLAAKWSDFEFWKAEGGRMDSQDCAQELQRLLSRLSASPADVGPLKFGGHAEHPDGHCRPFYWAAGAWLKGERW
jgi:hypothetical protein